MPMSSRGSSATSGGEPGTAQRKERKEQMRASDASGRSRSARVAAAVSASLVLLALGGVQVARATHGGPHDVTGTILARGPFTEELDVKVKARIGGDLGLVHVDDSADTIFQQITVAPGGYTDWHSHPGPAFVVVKEGTFTYYDGDDESCTGIDYGPGESFVDLGQGHVHNARNEGNVSVVLYVMYLDVPPEVASPFIPAEDPGVCEF
jgi:quercetin dioxygenase-like cupin family protein